MHCTVAAATLIWTSRQGLWSSLGRGHVRPSGKQSDKATSLLGAGRQITTKSIAGLQLALAPDMMVSYPHRPRAPTSYIISIGRFARTMEALPGGLVIPVSLGFP